MINLDALMQQLELFPGICLAKPAPELLSPRHIRLVDGHVFTMMDNLLAVVEEFYGRSLSLYEAPFSLFFLVDAPFSRAYCSALRRLGGAANNEVCRFEYRGPRVVLAYCGLPVVRRTYHLEYLPVTPETVIMDIKVDDKGYLGTVYTEQERFHKEMEELLA